MLQGQHLLHSMELSLVGILLEVLVGVLVIPENA